MNKLINILEAYFSLFVLLSFMLYYLLKCRTVYMLISNCNQVGYVITEVYLCVAQFSPFVSYCSRVQIFGNNANKSKPHAWKYEEQTKL
jgi:hypothetical protein